jgi:hypothetical protein
MTRIKILTTGQTGASRAASATTFTPASGVAATNVQAAIVEVATDVTDHLNDTVAAHAATAVSFSPTGTIAATTVQAAIAELDSETSSRFLPGGVADEFASYANGAPTTARLGGTWLLSGGSNGASAEPTVVSGKLTTTKSTGAVASYAQIQMANEIDTIGARWTFGSQTTTNGVVALVAFAADVDANWPTIPNAPCHLVCGVTTAGLDVWSGGSSTNLVTWTFDTALATDGTTVHTMWVVLDKLNGTAYVYLPDGSLRTVSDSRIKTLSGKYATFEVFRLATTDTTAAFTEVWASDQGHSELPRAKWEAARDVARARTVKYAPATNQDKVIATSSADLDATNLKITGFIAPPSGKCLVEFNGIIAMSGSTRVFFSADFSGANYGTTNVISQQYSGAVSYQHLVTGLTAGQSYDIKWKAFALASSTATLKLDEPNGYQAHMSVLPIFV